MLRGAHTIPTIEMQDYFKSHLVIIHLLTSPSTALLTVCQPQRCPILPQAQKRKVTAQHSLNSHVTTSLPEKMALSLICHLTSNLSFQKATLRNSRDFAFSPQRVEINFLSWLCFQKEKSEEECWDGVISLGRWQCVLPPLHGPEGHTLCPLLTPGPALTPTCSWSISRVMTRMCRKALGQLIKAFSAHWTSAF